MLKNGKQFLTANNFYNSVGPLDNKLVNVSLKGFKKTPPSLRNNVSKYLNIASGQKKLDLIIANGALSIIDNNKQIWQVAFQNINQIQFGVIKLIGGVMTIPTNFYYLSMMIQYQNSKMIVLIDKELIHYPEYLRLLQNSNIPISNPFEIEKLLDMESHDRYDYLQKNYGSLAKRADYPSDIRN